MRFRTLLTIVLILILVVVIQTTLFGRLSFAATDLVMLTSILLALTRVRAEAVLGVAFLSGLVVDLLGSSVLGLRAIVFSLVAYTAVRTRERAEHGRIATSVWAGVLTLMGAVLLVLVGTVFGQMSLIGEGIVGKILIVPVVNGVLAAIFSPLFVRLVDGDRSTYRFA